MIEKCSQAAVILTWPFKVDGLGVLRLRDKHFLLGMRQMDRPNRPLVTTALAKDLVRVVVAPARKINAVAPCCLLTTIPFPTPYFSSFIN